MARKIRSLKKWPKGCAGAKSSDLCNATDLAVEAWGDAADDPDTGPLAFAYLYRRFGPPPFEGDSYKDLAMWILTTRDPDVFVCLTPSGSAALHAPGYLVRKSLEEDYRKPRVEWEQKAVHWLAERVAEEHPEWVTHRDDGLDELTEGGWSLAYERRMTWGPGSWTERVVAEIGKPPREPMADEWRDGSPIMRRVNEAVLGTLRSLLRPVGVRDIDLTILGRVGREPRPSGFAASMRQQREEWRAKRAAKAAS